MSKLINTYIALFCSSLVFLSCDSDDPVDTTREDFIESIAATWSVDESSHVLLGDQDVTDLLIGFEITIKEDLTYTTNSNELTLEEFPWNTSGSFTLNEELTQLTRDDGLQITLTKSDDDLSLDLDFAVDENTEGRTDGVRGEWRCRFRRR